VQNGTVEMRTFKMVVTKSLTMTDDTGVTNINLTTNENNLGEYLYTKTVPFLAYSRSQLTQSSATSPNTTTSSTALAHINGVLFYPSLAPSDDYDNLPPEPAPIVNSLTVDKNYRFTVTATLKEWNGSSWVNALKNDLTPVSQTIVKNFRTGEAVLTANTIMSNY
jgi:hypothetical protein